MAKTVKWQEIFDFSQTLPKVPDYIKDVNKLKKKFRDWKSSCAKKERDEKVTGSPPQKWSDSMKDLRHIRHEFDETVNEMKVNMVCV